MKRVAYTMGWWSVPALWALNMQLGQILPYDDCVAQHSRTGVTTLIIIVAAAGVGAVSGIHARRLVGTERFLALAGSLIASIIAFALLLQGLATLVIEPCAH
jgi:hypothetical protein